MTIRETIAAVACCAIVIGWVGALEACSCPPTPSVEAGLDRADTVFHGRVVRIHEVPGDPAATITFLWLDGWKGRGNPGTTLVIQTPSRETPCVFPFVEGNEYLIYADRTPSGELETHLCTRTRAIEDAQAQQDLIELRRSARSSPDAANRTTAKLEQQLALLMDQHRTRQPLSVDAQQLVAIYGAQLIPALDPHLKDSSERVRWQACALLWLVSAHGSTGATDRQQIVERLVQALDDPEGLVWQKTAGWLLSFTEADFSETAKQSLHELLARKRAESAEVGPFVLVIGVADMSAELPILHELLIDEGKYEQSPHAGRWYGTDSWAARRARARMGVAEDIQRCIQLVEAEPNKIVRYGTLFDHLQYLRQPHVIPVLTRYLNSGEPALFQSHDSGLSPASYWAAAALGHMLRDVPVKKDVSSLTEEDIQRCRRWMATQQTWDIIR